MTEHVKPDGPAGGPPLDLSAQPAWARDSGLACIAAIAGHYRIAAEPAQLSHELGLGAAVAGAAEMVRAAGRLGLKGRWSRGSRLKRLAQLHTPFIMGTTGGDFMVVAARLGKDRLRVVDFMARTTRELTLAEIGESFSGDIIQVTRRIAGAGSEPRSFGLNWFMPSILRYRSALAHVFLASLLVQLFALVTPLFFQVVIDKVLVHQGFSTLLVICVGLAGVALFDTVMQYLRTYALSHTTSRIDVELGARLFEHLLRLPLKYFETRPAGQTIARMRELETIRSFLTSQGLTCVLDLVFGILFMAILFLYSPLLAAIVAASIPVYVLISLVVLPSLKAGIEERFNRGAETQQFLVETVVGAHTLKAAAMEPILRSQWEEKLAAYVSVTFRTLLIAGRGQGAIQLTSKLTTALVLFFGAHAVIKGEMTVGALVAFNMIMGQVSGPILRLSQLWQEFQQVRVSVNRLGDILNAQPESRSMAQAHLGPARGAIAVRDVSFRYRPDGNEVLSNINLDIPVGQVVGIVGPSGSGKSTLTKLFQRLYLPERGQILVDGIDVSQVDPAWLRRQIGVVLQENILFNRTIHENIALAAPGLSRALVIQAARLSGADEFIAKLPLGYDTMVEERGANLSGGQRQRIAIARSLVTNPRILIFDEATSALDYESERVIQRNMRQITQGRTVIIIAHRLAAVRDCDRIITIENGKVVEDGPHRTLLAEGGLYSRLWRMQTETVS